MRSVPLSAFLLLISLSPASPAAELVRDDFESELSAERWHTSGFQVRRAFVTTEVPAFHGAACVRIGMEPGDNRMVGRQGNGTERFELTLREAMVELGREVWYAFAFRVPADFPAADTRTMIHQFKENVRPIPADLPPGAKHCEKASPMFALYLEKGRKLVALCTSSSDCDHTRHRIAERGIEPDRWYEVMVHTRPSHGADGFLDLYLDGELVGRYRGVLGYVCHGLGHIDTQPRFGVYRDAHPAAGAARLYFDALRFAATREGLALP